MLLIAPTNRVGLSPVPTEWHEEAEYSIQEVYSTGFKSDYMSGWGSNNVYFEAMKNMTEVLVNNSKDLDYKIGKLVQKNFWKLV